MSKQVKKTKENMKQSNNVNMVLSRGTQVEVKNDEEGFKGAWYGATILKKPTSTNSKKAKVFVIYNTLLEDDGVHFLSEQVCVENIRPFPPNDQNVRPFEVYEVVDALYNDGWWKGVVVEVREVNEQKKYKVLFENFSEEYEFSAPELRVHLDWIGNKWVKPPKQIDASLISSCQGQSDDIVDNKEREIVLAIQLESAGILNNSCEDILNSKFKGAKRKPCRSKAESSSPCKKFRREKYATRSSSAECEEKSAPLEQLIGEKIISCMLPKDSSNPMIGNLSSVESMWPINSGADEEEVTMEADTMTSIDKSGLPENSKLKGQQISASGGEENTAEHMATDSLENSCGSVIFVQPQYLCSEGETENRKGVLEEMLTPQFSADFMAEVNMVDIGTNCLVKSGGTLMDDQCQFLCLEEETSAPLVATQCMRKIVTDDVTDECMLKSCATSNVDKKFQLSCSEGGVTNSKLVSTETSTSLSATNCMTKKPDMVDIPKEPDTVDMAIDHVAKSSITSAVHQTKFSCFEGHSPSNTQNQFDDQIDGETITGTESHVTNVEVNNAVDENEVMPFVKSSSIWKMVDSLEVFKIMPQNPHFRPLMKLNEAFREGFALSYMITFATVVEDISKLQIIDSQNKFTNCLETLAELETHGFSVKPAMDRVNMLLSIKDGQRQLEDHSKGVEAQLAAYSCKKTRLEANILVIDNVLRELRKDCGLFMLLAKNNNRDITALQQDNSIISEGISAATRDFESLVAASW